MNSVRQRSPVLWVNRKEFFGRLGRPNGGGLYNCIGDDLAKSATTIRCGTLIKGARGISICENDVSGVKPKEIIPRFVPNAECLWRGRWWKCMIAPWSKEDRLPMERYSEISSHREWAFYALAEVSESAIQQEIKTLTLATGEKRWIVRSTEGKDLVNLELHRLVSGKNEYRLISGLRLIYPRSTRRGDGFVTEEAVDGPSKTAQNEAPSPSGAILSRPIQSPTASPPIISANEYAEELDAAVVRSCRMTSAARKERLAQAPAFPARIEIVTSGFRRNPDVIAEVLHRADGYCESCKEKAPFIRKFDETPYLEVHHKKPLSEDGEDTVENAIAVCPNCHRKAHYG